MSKSPAFQFYPSDFYLGTDDMTAAQVGGYIRLLCKQWDKNVLPFDEKTLKKWAGLNTSDLAEVLKKFVKIDEGYINERMEKERQKQEQYKVSKSEAGKVGMAKRWGSGNNTVITENNSPIDVLITKNNSSSSSSSSSSIKEKEVKVKATPPPPLIDVEPEILERYLKFETWAKENAPRVLKMKEPLTPKQLQSLLEVSDAISVKTILEEMHNWADLTKKVSTYKTAKTWLERRKTNPISKQPEPQQKSSYDRKFKGYE